MHDVHADCPIPRQTPRTTVASDLHPIRMLQHEEEWSETRIGPRFRGSGRKFRPGSLSRCRDAGNSAVTEEMCSWQNATSTGRTATRRESERAQTDRSNRRIGPDRIDLDYFAQGGISRRGPGAVARGPVCEFVSRARTSADPLRDIRRSRPERIRALVFLPSRPSLRPGAPGDRIRATAVRGPGR